MSNNNGRLLSASKARGTPKVLIPVRMGYLDLMNGAPYPQEYETAIKWWQNNYNAGRLIAAEVKASGAKVKWPANTILPKAIQEISKHVARELQPMAAQ